MNFRCLTCDVVCEWHTRQPIADQHAEHTTAVRGCNAPRCMIAEAKEYGVTLDELKSSRARGLDGRPEYVVTYWCDGCGKALQMETAKPGDLVLIGRAWCWRCMKYVTKAQARATSEERRRIPNEEAWKSVHEDEGPR